MKKSLLVAGLLATFSLAKSQVGINTSTPTATLDVTAKNSTGTGSSVEGLLIPRVDRQKAQSMTGVPVSTLIYVNSIATGTAAGTALNIDTVGYYYYDGTVWTKISNPVNIYNADGTLTGNRTVTQGANTLAFTGTQTNAFSVDGTTLSVDAANHRLGLGTTTPDTKLTISTPDSSFGLNHTNGTINLKTYIGGGSGYLGTTTANDLRLMTNNSPKVTVTSGGDVGIATTTPDTRLTISTPDGSYGLNHTNGTVNLKTYIGGGSGYVGTTTSNNLNLMANNGAKVIITPAGNVGIGISAPDQTLDVNGNVKVRSLAPLASSTISAVYADENGVLGKSNVSPQSQVSFYTSGNTMPYNATSYNSGTTQIVQIQSSDSSLNTIGTTVPATGTISISQAGNYMLSGSISPSLGMNNDGDGYAYMAVNLDVSTDGGASWTSVAGGRPMFPRVIVGTARLYSFTISPVIKFLNPGNLIRIAFYRTKDGASTLQGASMSSVSLDSYYGAPTYTLSINKL